MNDTIYRQAAIDTLAVSDIGQVVAIVVKEFEETLRNSVEQCMF